MVWWQKGQGVDSTSKFPRSLTDCLWNVLDKIVQSREAKLHDLQLKNLPLPKQVGFIVMEQQNNFVLYKEIEGKFSLSSNTGCICMESEGSRSNLVFLSVTLFQHWIHIPFKRIIILLHWKETHFTDMFMQGLAVTSSTNDFWCIRTCAILILCYWRA